MNKSRVDVDFQLMCRVGYGCGLQTLAEAYSQVQGHYDAFFLISEAPARLEELAAYIDKTYFWDQAIRDVMGDEWCDLLDAEEQAYWKTEQ